MNRPSSISHASIQHRWFVSASKGRWFTSVLLYLTLLITAMVLFIMTLTKYWSYVAPLAADFGSFYFTVLTWESGKKPGILTLIFVANSPQLILSILYFFYNGLITYMLMADEWSGFSKTRKGLRVTSASGAQRSTYRLQIP